jgi:glycosyltransferase involved in cell wall biosynthesis
MGVKDEALYFCPFTVDEKPLREAAQNRDTNRRVFLEQYALPSESFAVLFVGKLNARKRPKDLIEAMLLIYECGHQNVHLFLAGDGPERTALRSMVTPQIAPYIHFMGFVSVTDLPTLLSSVDLLVQPSEYDPHPLAISEALYCGLPIAASAGVGSIGSTDEVRPGINGFSFDIGDIAKIAECICSLSSDAELHKRFSEASLNISTERDMKTAISGFMAAVTGTGHTGTL